jgi:hypothetical protein
MSFDVAEKGDRDNGAELPWLSPVGWYLICLAPFRANLLYGFNIMSCFSADDAPMRRRRFLFLFSLAVSVIQKICWHEFSK